MRFGVIGLCLLASSAALYGCAGKRDTPLEMLAEGRPVKDAASDTERADFERRTSEILDSLVGTWELVEQNYRMEILPAGEIEEQVTPASELPEEYETLDQNAETVIEINPKLLEISASGQVMVNSGAASGPIAFRRARRNPDQIEITIPGRGHESSFLGTLELHEDGRAVFVEEYSYDAEVPSVTGVVAREHRNYRGERIYRRAE